MKRAFFRIRSQVPLTVLFLSFGTGYFMGLLMNLEWCSELCCHQIHCSDGMIIPYNKMSSVENDVQKKSTFLVIIVFSSPGNKYRRDAIRETWLRLKGERQVVTNFVIGTKDLQIEKYNLVEEQRKYGDLLLLSSVKDSYSELTVKLLNTLVWINNHLSFHFFLKTDDDSFVRLDALYDELASKNLEKLYWGFFDGRSRVKKSGQWAEKEWILCDTYLPYARGGGYILSSDLVSFVAKNSHYLKLYKNEDVSMGTWLSSLKVNRIHDPRFDTEYKSRGCFNTYLITHKQSVPQIVDKYNNLQANGQLCVKEYRLRYSYIYNWDVVPSKCCHRNNTIIT